MAFPEPGHDTIVGAWRARIDDALDAALPDSTHAPHRLHAAMRHAALGGGKRMRPLLVYATGHAFGADEALLDAPATAVELIHAYSLIHDDLPAMDDDDLRRGRPTVHVAFDEATAILAGDALQSLAFSVLGNAHAEPAVVLAMVKELAAAAGAAGMCGGQALDIDATGKWGPSEVAPRRFPKPPDERVGVHSHPMSLHDLERLHTLKTGALLRASVRLGAIAAGVDSAGRQRLDRFADALGLAFQIRDDLLDVEGNSASLGKTAGKDAEQAKATFPALIGLDASRKRLQELEMVMKDALSSYGDATGALRALGRSAIERTR